MKILNALFPPSPSDKRSWTFVMINQAHPCYNKPRQAFVISQSLASVYYKWNTLEAVCLFAVQQNNNKVSFVFRSTKDLQKMPLG